jgi:predicted metal-dependent hydrolase
LSKEDLIKHLKNYLPSSYSITIKNKNNYLVQVKLGVFKNEVTIHPVFLNADKNILHDITDFILKKNKDEIKNIKKRLSDFFHENKKTKSIKVNTKHKIKNIELMFNNVIIDLKEKFPAVDFSSLKITWGRFTRNRTRSIRFGSFDKRSFLVRLHPILDNIDIPDYFIYSVIYHEVAHYIVFKTDTKARTHGTYFNKLLKSIDPFYKQGKLWEKANKGFFFR